MGDLLRRLDSDSLQEVLSRCDSNDLLLLMQTCKTLYEIVHSSPLIWGNRLWVDFGWKSFPGMVHDFRLYRTIRQQESVASIRFRGLFTSGGIDDGNTSYWVDNVFMEDTSPYCSHASSNIDIIGALLKQSEETSAKERSIRKYLRARCRYAAALLEHIHAADRTENFRERLRTIESYSDLQLKLFFLSLHDSFQQDSQLGQLLFYNVAPENLEEEQRTMNGMRRHLVSMEACRDRNIVGKNLDKVHDEDVLQRIEQGGLSMCIVESIVISREGQLTCPISCGAIFGCTVSGERAVCFESGLLESLTNSLEGALASCMSQEVSRINPFLFSSPEISEFNHLDSYGMLCAKSEEGLVPAFSRVCLQEKNIFVEFQQNRSVLSNASCDESIRWFPIGWFQFALDGVEFENIVMNRAGCEACEVLYPSDFENETAAESRISVPLKVKQAINFVTIKLITQENRMDAMLDGHDWPNIDLSSLTLQGRIVEL